MQLCAEVSVCETASQMLLVVCRPGLDPDEEHQRDRVPQL